MLVEIRSESFDPFVEISNYQSGLAQQGKFGATSIFIGTLRDFNESDEVRAMVLEHYPGMTEGYLHKISEEAMQRWDILDTLIIHRVGALTPNDPIMVLGVWSAHRAAAFDACRYLIEELKSRAPFWKKETLTTGERWVEKNTPA